VGCAGKARLAHELYFKDFFDSLRRRFIRRFLIGTAMQQFLIRFLVAAEFKALCHSEGAKCLKNLLSKRVHSAAFLNIV